MGRAPCSGKRGLKKGPWSPEEDQILINYIQKNGHGSWRALPELAGLPRCGKSCRLRWTNYLRPDIKRGSFTEEEGRTIIQLHGIVGNRWSVIASQLPGRTDNEIKNFWNTHLKKRLLKMGLDPSTHKPIEESNPNAPQGYEAVKRHKAQWENARLQAEARLSRESLIISSAGNYHTNSSRVEMPNNNPPADYFLKMWNSETGKAFRRENDHPNIGRGDDPLLSSEIRVSLVSSENSCGQSLHPNKKENDNDKDKDNSSQHCKIGDYNVETREVPSCVAYMTEDQATEELDFLGLPLDFLDTDDNNGNIESESRRNFEEQAASSWAELLDEDYWSNM